MVQQLDRHSRLRPAISRDPNRFFRPIRDGRLLCRACQWFLRLLLPNYAEKQTFNDIYRKYIYYIAFLVVRWTHLCSLLCFWCPLIEREVFFKERLDFSCLFHLLGGMLALVNTFQKMTHCHWRLFTSSWNHKANCFHRKFPPLRWFCVRGTALETKLQRQGWDGWDTYRGGMCFFFSIYYLKLCILYNLFRFVTKKNKFQKHTFKIWYTCCYRVKEYFINTCSFNNCLNKCPGALKDSCWAARLNFLTCVIWE